MKFSKFSGSKSSVLAMKDFHQRSSSCTGILESSERSLWCVLWWVCRIPRVIGDQQLLLGFSVQEVDASREGKVCCELQTVLGYLTSTADQIDFKVGVGGVRCDIENSKHQAQRVPQGTGTLILTLTQETVQYGVMFHRNKSEIESSELRNDETTPESPVLTPLKLSFYIFEGYTANESCHCDF